MMIFRASILTALALCSVLCTTQFVFAVTMTDPAPNYCRSIHKTNSYLQQYFAGTSFEELQKKYHNTIKSIYSEAIAKVESQKEKSFKSQCSSAQELPQTINRVALWTKAYNEFEQYTCALEYLSKVPTLSGTEVSLLQGISSLSQSQDRFLQEKEISKKLLLSSESLYGYYIDSYPLHLELMCLIGEIQLYNKALWKLIDGVVIIPSKFYNYGSTHQ